MRTSDTLSTTINGLDVTEYPDGRKITSMAETFSQSIGDGNQITQSGGGANASLAIKNAISTMRASSFSQVDSRFCGTLGTFKASYGSSSRMTDIIPILGMITDIIIGGLSTKFLHQKYVDQENNESLSAGVSLAEGYLKKAMSLVKYVGVFLHTASIAKQPTRFLMSVAPNTSMMSQISPVTRKRDYILQIVDYLLDAEVNVTSWLGNCDKVREAIKSYKENYGSDDWTEIPTLYLADAIANTAVDGLAELADAAFFGAALAFASNNSKRLYNKGMMIAVHNPTKEDEALIKAGKVPTPPMEIPADHQGFDIVISADGPIKEFSDEMISLGTVPRNSVNSKIKNPLMKENIHEKTKASLILKAGEKTGADPAADVKKMSQLQLSGACVSVNALKSFNVLSGDDVLITAKTPKRKPEVISYLALAKEGHANLKGSGNGTLDFDGGITLKSPQVSLTGGTTIIGATNGGILLSQYKSDGTKIDNDKPLISLASNAEWSMQVKEKQEDFNQKVKDCDALQIQQAEYFAPLLFMQEELALTEDETERLQKELDIETFIATNITPLEAQIDTAEQARDAAENELNQLQSNPPEPNLILRNAGEEGNQITLTQKEVLIAGKETIALQDSNGNKGLKIDLSGGKLETIGSSMKITLKGETVDIG